MSHYRVEIVDSSVVVVDLETLESVVVYVLIHSPSRLAYKGLAECVQDFISIDPKGWREMVVKTFGEILEIKEV